MAHRKAHHRMAPQESRELEPQALANHALEWDMASEIGVGRELLQTLTDAPRRDRMPKPERRPPASADSCWPTGGGRSWTMAGRG